MLCDKHQQTWQAAWCRQKPLLKRERDEFFVHASQIIIIIKEFEYYITTDVHTPQICGPTFYRPQSERPLCVCKIYFCRPSFLC